MERVAESDKGLATQGAWVRDQTRVREQRRQRANHMLEVSGRGEGRPSDPTPGEQQKMNYFYLPCPKPARA